MRLRKLEIDIIEASEVDRYKDGKKDPDEEEEEKPEPKLDILDDPVRMYLKQMGQVPLLTREQEVEISKRIEDAEEHEAHDQINRFGFVARAHLELAAKLIEGGERFDRVILDKKIESRERYMKMLPRLCKKVREPEHRPGPRIRASAPVPDARDAAKLKKFEKAVDQAAEASIRSSYFKQKVIEEFVHLADEHYAFLRTLQDEMRKRPKRGAHKYARGKGCGKWRQRSGFRLPNSTSATRNYAAGCARRCRPRPKWSRPTCASSFPSPRNTPTAASPSST